MGVWMNEDSLRAECKDLRMRSEQKANDPAECIEK